MRADRDRVEEALRGARFGKKWIRVSCPFCADDGHIDRKHSLGVSAATGRFECFRCGARGRLREPPNPELAHEYAEDQRKPQERVIVDPPEEYVPLASRSARASISLRPAIDYLQSRGVGSVSRWRKYQIGAAADGYLAGRVIVPLLTHDTDEWIGWVARLWRDKPRANAVGAASLKYINMKGMPRGTMFWNHRALLLPTDDPVMVVEGMFDALPYYDNAVACLGKPSAAQIEWLYEATRPVVVVLDGDAWEEAWALAARLRFDGVRCGFVRLPPKQDPNQVDPVWLLREARMSLSKAI